MSLNKVSLTSSPNQNFSVGLTIDGNKITLKISVSFNSMAGYWILSIANASNVLLIDSVPMITGSYPAGNLLQQQRYLNIGSWFLVNVSNQSGQGAVSSYAYGSGPYGAGPYGGQLGFGGIDYPGENNLGTDFELWVNDTPAN